MTFDEYDFSGIIEIIQERESGATVITDGFIVNERDDPDAAEKGNEQNLIMCNLSEIREIKF